MFPPISAANLVEQTHLEQSKSAIASCDLSNGTKRQLKVSRTDVIATPRDRNELHADKEEEESSADHGVCLCMYKVAIHCIRMSGKDGVNGKARYPPALPPILRSTCENVP